MMISTVKQAGNDDSETCVNVRAQKCRSTDQPAEPTKATTHNPFRRFYKLAGFWATDKAKLIFKR